MVKKEWERVLSDEDGRSHEWGDDERQGEMRSEV